MLFSTAYNAGEFGEALVNSTRRGGHLIYKWDEKTRKRVPTNKINNPCKMGITLDFIRNGTIDIIDPDKTDPKRRHVTNMGIFTGINELSIVPEEFIPLPKETITSVIAASLLTKPGRNAAIHNWCVKKDSISTSAVLLGKYFCKPPLPDSEIITITSARKRFLDSVEGAQQDDFEESSEDFAFIENNFKDKIAYDLESGWVKQDRGGWIPAHAEKIAYMVGQFVHRNKSKLVLPPLIGGEQRYVDVTLG
jgi:hypothetical protein